VWSCGIILYALITGTLPFDDDNIRKLLQKVKSGVYNMPSFVPPGPRDLIHRMLVLDPAKRITIAEIRRHPWFNSNGRVVPIPTVQLPDVRAPSRTAGATPAVVARAHLRGAFAVRCTAPHGSTPRSPRTSSWTRTFWPTSKHWAT